MQSHDRCSRPTLGRRALALAIAGAALPPLAHAQGMALEEVIVTAQKKLESVQEVPATINPITSDMLQKNTILEIDQVASITPGVNFERPDSRRGLARVAAVIREREAELVVVGLPLTLSGEEGEQAQAARSFAQRLAKAVDVPVELLDERLTTRMADRTGGNDSVAAAHLLESWLMKKRASA